MKMSNTEIHTLKFGGSSLQNATLIQQSVKIVSKRMQKAHPVVVVSAIGGVTDNLIELTDRYHKENHISYQILNKLETQHRRLFDELASPGHPKRGELQDLFGELRMTLENADLRNDSYFAWKDSILSIGERASALIFSAALSEHDIESASYEASHFVKTDSTFGEANVQRNATRKLIQKFLRHSKAVPVITGFIGSNDQQQITTLGRSGSDYSAGLIADALNADHLEIWTDVDGVLTTDPQWVPEAESIKQLSFGDIAELSSHGARVIHPKTIEPIQNKETTVLVKNSYNPEHPGTLITSDFNTNGALKTITITGPFVRLQIDQKHAYDLFVKLHEWSEGNPDAHPVAFTQKTEFEAARFLLKQSFFEQIKEPLSTWTASQNTLFNLDNNLYKLKKFSNQFNEGEELSGQVISLLHNNDIQPLHIERNYDERFISFLLPEKDTSKAAHLINNAISKTGPVVNLFIAGTGAVGQTLLEQLNELETDDFQFRLIGTCNSRKMLWNTNGIDLDKEANWDQAKNTKWDILLKKLTRNNYRDLVFVDATGSEEVARLYPELFSNGIHVVTPSKLANTFEQSFFDDLKTLTQQHHTSFRYETTVGAGLPVISTLNNLQSTGDHISEVSGVVSGTMTYLFNQLEEGVPFSKAIIEAREKGYAEPDPRDDLSGEDVARKFLTLARTLGTSLEREELQVESLIPEELKTVDGKTFLEKLPDYNNEWKQRMQKAKDRNETLRYTGKLKNGNISIGIESVSKDSPLGQLKGTDNLIQIYSDFYHETPLVIQGPGAGKKVTAAGVLSDIIKTANQITQY